MIKHSSLVDAHYVRVLAPLLFSIYIIYVMQYFIPINIKLVLSQKNAKQMLKDNSYLPQHPKFNEIDLHGGIKVFILCSIIHTEM